MATKKPADHKKARHAKSEKFIFETDDARLEVPFVENLPAYVITEMSGAQDEGEQTRMMIDLLFSDQEDEFRKLTLGEFIDFQEQWNAESSITLGEL